MAQWWTCKEFSHLNWFFFALPFRPTLSEYLAHRCTQLLEIFFHMKHKWSTWSLAISWDGAVQLKGQQCLPMSLPPGFLCYWAKQIADLFASQIFEWCIRQIVTCTMPMTISHLLHTNMVISYPHYPLKGQFSLLFCQRKKSLLCKLPKRLCYLIPWAS